MKKWFRGLSVVFLLEFVSATFAADDIYLNAKNRIKLIDNGDNTFSVATTRSQTVKSTDSSGNEAFNTLFGDDVVIAIYPGQTVTLTASSANSSDVEVFLRTLSEF